MKKTLLSITMVLALCMQWSCTSKIQKDNNRPIVQDNERKEKEEYNPDKDAIWTPEQAARHQKILKKLTSTSSSFNKGKFNNTYANGALKGTWKTKGPKNMPGAFKFAEMLDGTDIIYGVTHNHYVGEFNSKSYIFKGTIYNPKTGTKGDDFELLTANWPNRYQNLFAFKVNGNTRLVAHIENGPIYYSDDEGNSWIKSNGLPASNTSSAINRQDNHAIYVTNNRVVYVSRDFGSSFSVVQNFGNSQNSFLYSPRYQNQPNANSVYLARNGSFYTLNALKTSFIKNGTYISRHGKKHFSIGGDSRKLYVTENKRYWVSSDQGKNWTEKFPKGNYYGDTSRKMDTGKFLAVSPENANIVIGGYTNPVLSTTGLDNTRSNHTGWGNYQNGTNLSASNYYNRIRFNYHPDFQSSHFFYNGSGDLLSVRCSDGGIFVSYKEWNDFPSIGTSFNNSGYTNAHYVNINVLNTICPLIYRKNVLTGANNPNHISYSTQDQGSGSIIPGTTGETLDFYQSIGGDGPPLDSYDGINVWKWSRQGDKVWAPVKMYGSNGAFQSIGQINRKFNSRPTTSFTRNTEMGWAQTVIDHDQPDKRIWILTKSLNRATMNGSSITAHTVKKGTNQIAAIAQGRQNPNKIIMLQDGNVFISTNRGTSFGSQINTPFTKTPGGRTRGDIGSGVILPNNDNWVLFCGPSSNNVGAILSKDGGQTWIDVTGDFPSGNDAQTGGMIVTPDGKFVFAGTDIGPYVFDVASEKWFSIAQGIGFFNAMDVNYIASINTVRFGSWGSGILDFKIDKINTEQTAYRTHTIPGTIQTEDYDNGGQNIAYNDSNAKNNGGKGRINEGVDLVTTKDIGGGLNVGWIADQEWLEYTIANIKKGKYTVTFRIASTSEKPKSITAKLGSKNIGTVSVPKTNGSQIWKNVVLNDVDITDTSQNQIFRLDFKGGNFNINWVKFEETANPCIDAQLTLLFDNYPKETSWDIKNSNGEIIESGGPYDQSRKSTKKIDFCLDPGCYELTVYDSYGDGMCCLYGKGAYTLTDASGVLASGASFASSESKNFCIGTNRSVAPATKESTTLKNPLLNLRVYPIPANHTINIDYKIKEKSSILVKIIDITGRSIGIPISIKNNNSDNLQLPISQLPEGIYFLKAIENDITVSKKFIIAR
ncbi:carbohydrate-binding protein [Aquimarina sp. 2201CG1-2-11]|uniref:carbohydrate-binding protein n=1 Tax=Aquimarina discodermiae TaxID=3231043 RepID=UPI003461D308